MTATTTQQHPAEPVPARVLGQRRRAAARARELAELLERRPDLYGVHSPADLAAESVRWSA